MHAAYQVELLKLRRGRVPVVASVVVLLVPPLLAWAFLAAAQANRDDPLSAKAAAMALGDGWPGYLNGLTQIAATGGFVGIGIVVAWCFGREFADHTVVSLYASATSRPTVAAAKLVVITGWAAAVAVLAAPIALVIGLLAGLGSPDTATFAALGRLAVLLATTGLLALVVALFASLGRGYLAGFAGLVAIVVAPQLAIVAGVGAWFPWSAPALWAITPLNPTLTAIPTWHLLVVPLTALVTSGLTLAWWQTAELP